MDHVEQYKVPKDPDRLDEEQIKLIQEGCGPESSIARQSRQGESSRDRDRSPKMKKEKR